MTTVNSEIFAGGLFSQNFAYARFGENEILAKSQYHTQSSITDIHVPAKKRVKFTNCSQFLSHNFFGLDFLFYVIFLLIGRGQLDNDV